MNGIRLSVCLGMVLVGAGMALAQEPKPLTAEQKEKIKLRDQHTSAAQQLAREGKLTETIAEVNKKLNLEREVFGGSHAEIAATLHWLARLYESGNDYPAARKVIQEALDMQTHLYGPKDWRVTDARLAMAHLEVLAKLDAPGRQKVSRAYALNQQVVALLGRGHSLEALPLAQEALELVHQVLGENHRSYPQSLTILASLYKARGDYPKALPLFEQARDLRKKLLTEDHPDYATALFNLAALYKAMGDYRKALPLYEQARDLRKKLLTEDHPLYATVLNNLAGLYEAMGDYPKALPLYQRALDLRKKLLTEEHPAYAVSLNNLAGLYLAMGDYQKALPLFEQAHDLRAKLLFEDPSGYATGLNNLACVYSAIGDKQKALLLYEKACDLDKKLRIPDSSHRANRLDNLANLYISMGDYAKALPLAKQARDMRKKYLTENHPDYAASLSTMASLYKQMRDYSKAQELAGQAFELSLHLVESTFDVLGERQRLQAVLSLRLTLADFLSNASETQLPPVKAYTAILKWKGSVASRQNADLLLRDQPDIQPILTKLLSIKSLLAKTAFETPTPAEQEAWVGRLKQLRDDKEVLEEKLARASNTFRNLRRPPPSPDQVRQALPKRTALIDIAIFRSGVPREQRKIKSQQEWQNHLVAFVVHPDQDVRMVFVEDVKSLETQIDDWRQAVMRNNVVAQAEAAKQIHQRLWQPLQQHLAEIDTVLISADGPLLRFPFAALPGKRPGAFLLEDLTIGYVTSGRQVVDLLQTPDKDLAPPAGLLTLGGVNYGGAEGHQAFPPLPGTDLEASRVHQQYRDRFPDERATTLAAKEPTRAKVMAEVNKRYRYLHLATHGFFDSPDRIARLCAGLRATESGLVPKQGPDDILAFLPLLKSGLALAGANKGSGDESLLTAEDLAGLDLRGCDLVVLSACETGLGTVTQGDGVLGLQRGFHASGARSVVASLWNVNDAATSVLMEEFYKNLWRKEKPLGKLEALRQAQLFVLNNPKRVEERRQELRGELVKRGQQADSLRGPKGDAVTLVNVAKTEPGQRRSPVSSWAAFVLSGETEGAKR